MIVPAASADIVWVYRRGRRHSFAEWERGECSSEFFYGLVPLRTRYRVGFVEGSTRPWFGRPWWPVEQCFARRLGIGFALDLAVRHLGTLNRARVVVSTVDACGLPLGLLKRRGMLRSRLIYISQGLSDRIQAYGVHRGLARWCRTLVLAADAHAALSAGAADGLAAWLGLPRERVGVLPFGVDHEFWHDTAPRGADARIVSVGSDAGRDYPTLLASAGGLPLHIVTRQVLAVPEGADVRVTHEHSAAGLRDIYSGSRFVVTPLHERDQPSGQSAALQAMACGRAVILTRTRGWWGEDVLVDGDNCVLVGPGDAEALRRALHALWDDPERCRRIGTRARATVERWFGEERFAESLAALVSPATGIGADRPA
jgi:glycosyltransferase involved in cell wall biosynthesis